MRIVLPVRGCPQYFIVLMDYDTMKTFALSSERPFYDPPKRVAVEAAAVG
jgi:hypothetical protein